ncbi:MAG TPA: ribokinase [Anaerolineales bacterium]|nr:ribokinase [Anaerolineales bacterium]
MTGVVVVGSVNIDLVVRLPRLPRPGETVIGGVHSVNHGGKGANQAVAVARLGGDVVLVAAVGRDEFGAQAVTELVREGVRLSVVRKELPTGVAQIMVGADGENMIAVASGANQSLEPEDIQSALVPYLTEGAVVLASLEVPHQAVLAAARLARDRKCTFILNPAPAQPLSPELLRCCNILTPNEHEMAGLGFDQIADVFQYGLEAVVVTRGAQGADLLGPRGFSLHYDAFPIQVIDTTGAGDAFNATLAWAISNGQQTTDALRLAMGGGALATRALGARAGMASQAELLGFIEGFGAVPGRA